MVLDSLTPSSVSQVDLLPLALQPMGHTVIACQKQAHATQWAAARVAVKQQGSTPNRQPSVRNMGGTDSVRRDDLFPTH